MKPRPGQTTSTAAYIDENTPARRFPRLFHPDSLELGHTWPQEGHTARTYSETAWNHKHCCQAPNTTTRHIPRNSPSCHHRPEKEERFGVCKTSGPDSGPCSDHSRISGTVDVRVPRGHAARISS